MLARFGSKPNPRSELKLGRFPQAERLIPPELVQPLQAWHASHALRPHVCTMAEGVPDAYYAYHDALQRLIAQSTVMDLDGGVAGCAA